MRLIRTGDIQPDRFSAGREQKLVERHGSTLCKRHLPRSRVDRRHFGPKLQFDRLILVEAWWPKRHPVLERVAGKVVLRAIRPVVGSGIVGGEKRQVAVKSFSP